jgi:hypothetical protein
MMRQIAVWFRYTPSTDLMRTGILATSSLRCAMGETPREPTSRPPWQVLVRRCLPEGHPAFVAPGAGIAAVCAHAGREVTAFGRNDRCR